MNPISQRKKKKSSLSKHAIYIHTYRYTYLLLLSSVQIKSHNPHPIPFHPLTSFAPPPSLFHSTNMRSFIFQQAFFHQHRWDQSSYNSLLIVARLLFCSAQRCPTGSCLLDNLLALTLHFKRIRAFPMI